MISEKEDRAEEKRSVPGRERKVACLEDLMTVVMDFNDGPMDNPEPPHSHPHEQITYVAGGKVLFLKDNVKYELTEGDLVTIPSGVPHCIQTLTEHVRLVDSFTPVRKDFIETKK
jgi:mannose-6-phosphate isomerase-like protein (cupin superfamily)